MPTASEVEDLHQETGYLGILAIAALVEQASDLPADPVEAAQTVREVAAYVGDQAASAGVAAAHDFYASVRPAGSPRYTPPLTEPRAITGGTANWMTQPMTTLDAEPDLEATFRRTAAAIEKEIMDSVAAAIGEATAGDPLDARYARFPQSSNPCSWCVLRASRGAMYWTEESASAGDHLHCRCRVTAVFPDEPLPYLRAPYMAQYLAGADAAEGRGTKALLAGMRRANGTR